jgi:hypothetical protein
MIREVREDESELAKLLRADLIELEATLAQLE